ncbi:MAG: DNA photolyase [Gammaproteobacteria bacterium]|nr:MAG: DNA photolyase [Gammaproteobacteria bacterium]
MPELIYIEEAVRGHPHAQRILKRFPRATVVPCNRYTEIFNPKAQNFRLQKQSPALILAEKHGTTVLPAPPGYGIGSRHNYYFSHMLNCPYDCRYCFLQGMYRSAHYVIFINYDKYIDEINETIAKSSESVHFFSGYDADSLAYDPITGFVDQFLPVFRQQPSALLELRTKSTQIRSLLRQSPIDNCVVAFSFTPQSLGELENGVPSLSRRLAAMQTLQENGWQLGIRFDPLIYHKDYRTSYADLFREVFDRLDVSRIHSVSLGTFRVPERFFEGMWKLYPEEPFFSGSLQRNPANGMVGYSQTLENEMIGYCESVLLTYISSEQYFPCKV